MGAVVLALVGLAVLAGLVARGPLEVSPARERVAAALERQFGAGRVSVGSVAIASGEGGLGNQLVLRDLVVRAPGGGQALRLADVRTRLSLSDLLAGRIALHSVTFVGTELTARRDGHGRIDILPAGGEGPPDLGALLELLSSRAELAELERVTLEDARITLLDSARGRRHVFDGAQMTLRRSAEGGFELRSEVRLPGADGAAEAASLRLGAEIPAGPGDIGLSLQFNETEPALVADLVSAFDWLRHVDSRASGSVRATLSSDGSVSGVSGVLDLGEGRLTGTPDRRPVRFDHAKIYFDYDRVADTLQFREVAVRTAAGAFSASGYAALDRAADGAVASLTGQVTLTDIVIDRADLFDAPVSLPRARLDARVGFAPLRIEVGQLTLFDGSETYALAGESVAGAEFWQNRYAVRVSGIDAERLKQIWPKPAAPKARLWVFENIAAGQVRNFAGGFRTAGGNFSFEFDFDVEGASARLVKTVPFLQEGRGVAKLTSQSFRARLTSGHVVAGDGTKVALDGSEIFIPDIWIRPTPGEIDLRMTSGLTAALHLLDAPRFRFISKAGLTPEVAQGQVEVAGRLTLPLKKGVRFREIDFDIAARLRDVASDTLVKGRALRAESLALRARPAGLELEGDLTLDGVAAHALWTQPFGPAAQGGSHIVARAKLGARELEALGVALPPGSIGGAAEALVDIRLRKGRPPEFSLRSNLAGARLAIPAIGWAKPAAEAGVLTVAGALGEPLTVDRLELAAAGLNASGSLSLLKNGRLLRAEFPELKFGGWLKTALTYTPRGEGGEVTLAGGTLDLRALGGAAGSDRGGAAGPGTRLNARLDEVTVSDEIRLTDVTARLDTLGGTSGTFRGRIGGRAEVAGRFVPHAAGTAVELTAGNAGEVLAATGLFTKARGGRLRMVLIPRSGRGNYDGTFRIEDVRLRNLSALADLLNAISLVGLVQQMQGSGIHFATVDGQFALRNGAVQLRRVSAIGPSMGLTLDGWYDTRARTVDFEGVATPLYAVNGVFERVFGSLVGRRKGEGMFSFTYRMRGPAADPKVSVNPLSILTPGLFREIFRQDPPKPPPGQGGRDLLAEERSTPRASGKQVEGEDDAPERPRHSAPQSARDIIR